MSICETINQLEQAYHADFVQLSRDIWSHPELGHEEHHAVAVFTEYLERQGFSVTRNYMDIPTAFRAEYDTGHPGAVIGFLSEYDALPQVGHGCGHNLIGTIGVGSGVILSKLMEHTGGKVIVFGCPAEETSGAKVKMSELGCFDELDAAMMAHPESKYYKSGVSLAMEALRFEYFGKATHAATSPQDGINALEGVIQLFVNINGLRQHILPSARIHGVIRNGGVAPNIVPDYASAEFHIRATSKEYLEELSRKVRNCAQASALSTGTRVEISNYEESYYDLRTNQNLSTQVTENLHLFGVEEINEPRKSFGSIDMGNVSHRCPGIHPYFPIVDHGYVTAHSKDFAAAAVTDYAHEQMGLVIKSFAKTGYDILTDQDLRSRIRQEFAGQNV